MGVKWQKGKEPQQGKLTCGTGVTPVSCSHQPTKDVGWKRTAATGWQLLKHLGRLLAVRWPEDKASPSYARGDVWSAGTLPLWLPTLGHHYRHLKISVIQLPLPEPKLCEVRDRTGRLHITNNLEHSPVACA